MAAVFQFKTGTTTIIDMLTGDFRVDGDKYVPAPAPEIPGDGSMPPDIVEVIPFYLTASSDNALATDLQTLDGLKTTAANYRNNSHVETAVWWHHQLPAETNARRVLVKRFEYQLEKNPDGTLVDRLKGIPGTITLTRAPYWEATAVQAMDTATYSALNFDNATANFTAGETITGATTGHTAIVMGMLGTADTATYTTAGRLFLKDASGTFQNNEELNGSVGGSAMALANGVLTGAAALMIDYTGAGSGGTPAAHDVVGDVRGRFDRLTLAVATGDQLGRIWAGFRSANLMANPEYFSPIWRFGDYNGSESGITTDSAGDTSGADPGGGAGRFVKLVETDLNWDDGTPKKVCGSYLETYGRSMLDGPTETRANMGSSLWLLRAKVTSGTWRVHMRWGYQYLADADAWIKHDPVDISSTSWNYYEMGVQGLPLVNFQALSMTGGEGATGEIGLQLWAERVSGSGDLYLNCMCPIPIDEGYLFISGMSMDDTDVVEFGESSAGRASALIADTATTYTTGFPAFEARSFGPPPGDGRLIIVHARASTSDLTDYLKTAGTCQYYERWASYRGAE